MPDERVENTYKVDAIPFITCYNGFIGVSNPEELPRMFHVEH